MLRQVLRHSLMLTSLAVTQAWLPQKLSGLSLHTLGTAIMWAKYGLFEFPLSNDNY